MSSYRTAVGLLLALCASFAAGSALGSRSARTATGAAGSAAQASNPSFPKDVYADTGSRLPAIKREDLDEAGQKLFDGRPSPDAFGPLAIRLYSLPVAEHMGAVNTYLRFKSGVDPRLMQLTILVAARESDSEYVWTAHEPQALHAGLSPEIVDIVKYRKPATSLGEKETAIIELEREVLEKHHVSPATFARAQKLFGNKQLVEYVSLMGDYTATAILLNAFDQHVRPADKPLLPIAK